VGAALVGELDREAADATGGARDQHPPAEQGAGDPQHPQRGEAGDREHRGVLEGDLAGKLA
jgi:hypothetical protein